MAFDGGELHRLVDGGGSHVERAAEDEGEAEDVVDLIRIVASPACHDRIRAGGAHQFRHDLRVRVGECEDDGPGGEFRQPVGVEHPGRGEAHEDVGTLDHVGQRAGVGVAGVAGHVLRHVRVAAGVDHAADVGERHVVRRQAHRHQQVHASDGGGTGARRDQAHVGEVLLLQHQRVAHGGGDRDGGAVLVVVEDGDLHPFAQASLDDEAFRRLDVFEVDGAEGWFERGDDADEQLGVGGVHLDVEHVDAGELLEQRGFALHHRLAGERADVAQSQHGGAVGDDGDEVGAGGEFAGGAGVGDDGGARGRDAWGVGEGEVALGGHALGGLDGDFAGAREAVVVERGLAEVVVHLNLSKARGSAPGPRWCQRPQTRFP